MVSKNIFENFQNNRELAYTVYSQLVGDVRKCMSSCASSYARAIADHDIDTNVSL